MVNPRDILGMNARNLLYIRPHNLRLAIRLADSKLKTKKVLEAAKIPTPKLYGIFKHARQLENFNWEELPGNVVLKPNRGFGGEGIVVFSKKGTNDKGESIWITSSSNEWTADDLKRHIINILDGNYSLQNIPDVAFFEEKIITHRDFRKFTYKGLPDVRVIVYNKAPVMSMMRLPTKWSKGKANLALGAIGAGIDMATGRTTSASIKKPVRRRIFKHPDTKQDLKGLAVPYWNEVLEMAIRCQEVSDVGFLGVDIAVDEKRGPLVLELNARAGLEIQNVNLSPLASRLRRVEGLKIDSVEKGVRLAKELFGGGSEKKVDELISKPVIGAEETIEIILPDNKRHRVLARIDTGEGLSVIDTDLAARLGLKSPGQEGTVVSETKKQPIVELSFSLAGEKIKTTANLADRSRLKYPVSIGRRDLRAFIIDPERKEKVTSTKTDYKKADAVLADVHRKLALTFYLNPVNLNSERDKFFAENTYNPSFNYEKPTEGELSLLRTRVDRFKLEMDTSPLGKIFYRKQQDLLKKIEMVKNIGTPDFTKYAIELYGEPSDDLIESAEKHYRNPKPGVKDEPFLSQKNILRTLREHLEVTNIPYKIVVLDDLPARISIQTSEKSILINLRRDARFRRSDLEGTIAHEIETHAYRYANGMLQPYKIFSEGLAGYLSTEEGLAVYNKERIYKNPRTFITRYLKVLAVNEALASSFRETYKFFREKGVLPQTAFAITYKAKRGLKDTSRPGGFPRECVYAKGYLEIKEYLDKGFALPKLYVGKVGIKDLPNIDKLTDIKEPKYIPSWMKS
ncbi:tyrosine/phenylalanine carboxypeptidase domain-containing protein [Patescibacteria group bacterium]